MKSNTPEIKQPILIGLISIAVLFFGFLIWAFEASISSASVAKGVLVVDSKKKTIEHAEGGIVTKIYVKEGSDVKKGEPLLELDDLPLESDVHVLLQETTELKLSLLRLRAELRGEEKLVIPQPILELAKTNRDVNQQLKTELHLFKSEKQGIQDKQRILEQRVEELERIRGNLQDQLEAKYSQLGYLQEEIESVTILEKEQLLGRPTLLGLKREEASLLAEMARIRGEIANTEQKIGEASLEIIQDKNTLQEQILEEIKETQKELYGKTSELTKLEDKLKKTQIVSPIDGQVVDLRVTNPGDVISSGEKLMDIVPLNDNIVVEAYVKPVDIDVVHPGLEAKVRIIPFKQRKVPLLIGTVKSVSADIIKDPKTQEQFYLAYVDIPKEELEKIKPYTLHPGMPTEVMIIHGDRPPIDYILTPVKESFNRSFREE